MASDRGINVRVQRGDFDVAHEQGLLTEGRTDVGAVVAFTGLCRGEGGRLAALELEHYPGMAEAELTRIATACRERWPVSGMTIVHRFGRIEPGENIVLVVAASPHRQAAFEAAQFAMDFLKTDAPFWKKQHMADGGEAGWVEARDADKDAANRW